MLILVQTTRVRSRSLPWDCKLRLVQVEAKLSSNTLARTQLRRTTRYTPRMPSQTTCRLISSTFFVQNQGYGSIIYSLGPVEPDTVEKVEVVVTDEEKARLERVSARPSLDEILNLHDFEVSQPYRGYGMA